MNLDLNDVEGLVHRPGSPIRLADIPPRQHGPFDEKEEGKEALAEDQPRLNELQEQLYAQGKRGLLVVLQGMDAAGKDGAIRHVMGAFNPQGVEVTSFKVPTAEELAHDFLWRIHKAAPRRGMVGIFNRSHYEDVGVVRVKSLVPKEVWEKRYDQINELERILTEGGVKIVKFFLHISPGEQEERLAERQSRPDKQWKFNPGDLEDRALWPDFMEAYSEALTRCNTEHAPWYVVPADRKWFRNVVVSEVLISALEGMGLGYPDPPPDVESYEIPKIDWP